MKNKENRMSENEKRKDNLIVKLSFEFAVKVVQYTEKLESLKKYNMANQLFRSATSIGANVHEAQSAESKEVRETMYWLKLCGAVESYPDHSELIDDVESIIKVIGKIISTSKSTQLAH